MTLLASGLALGFPTSATAAPDWEDCLDGSRDRQAVFERAAEISGAPAELLLAVSYMQSRWDDHGASPSTSGGYGPMHLTDVPADLEAEPHHQGKGDPSVDHGHGEEQGRMTSPGTDQDTEALQTLDEAARLTGYDRSALRSDDVANVCGGAALLADYQADVAPDALASSDPSDWSGAVARYSGAADEATALAFTERVFTVLSEGEARRTNDGHRVRLAATDAEVDESAVESLGLEQADAEGVECPTTVSCESIPAPYEHYDPEDPTGYGNHDLANREEDLDIEYIIVHNTEATWDTTLDLVTRPTYLAWHYSLRSSDGHIAQHVDNQDVGWHAGNWYVNMHSIGLEHEGFAAHGANWFTESMYQTSAELVRYLGEKYDVPLDRGHIIGHDQIPGVAPANVRGMHWDPGPYWDWKHYMQLLGSPVKAQGKGKGIRKGDLVTVAPRFHGNDQEITGCGGTPCLGNHANFVYLHTAPSADAPLVKDVGLRPDGSNSTTHVSDIGARAAYGHEFQVARKRPGWLGVWYLGEIAWLEREHAGKSVVKPTRGKVVVAAGEEPVPVYGRAYPEESAYPETIPYQALAPLQYTVKPGQAYVVADRRLQSDYYYAKTYNCAYLADDCTQVLGEDRYYQIWFGHRFAYVRAADVELQKKR